MTGASIEVDPLARELGERFEEQGFELYLVGGVVRDALLGRASKDLDLATSARPDETLRVLQGLQTGGLCAADWKPGQENLKV